MAFLPIPSTQDYETTSASPSAALSKLLYFNELPPKGLILAFQAHVKATGTPDTFQGLSLTPPPNNMAGSTIIDDIQLDSKKGVRVRCYSEKCKGREKFFKGKLIWSREDGHIRVIGHECARGTADSAGHYDRMLAEEKKRLEKEQNTEFIYKNLHLVPFYLEAIQILKPVVQQVLEWRSKMGHPAFQEIAQIIRSAFKGHGQLVVSRKKKLPDSDDEYVFVEEVLHVMSGKELFTISFQPLEDLLSLDAFLTPLNEKYAADADGTTLEILMSEKLLQEVTGMLRQCGTKLNNLRERLLDATSFFAPSNLNGLKLYGSDTQIPIRLFSVGFVNGTAIFKTPGKGEVLFTSVPLNVPSLNLPQLC